MRAGVDWPGKGQQSRGSSWLGRKDVAARTSSPSRLGSCFTSGLHSYWGRASRSPYEEAAVLYYDGGLEIRRPRHPQP